MAILDIVLVDDEDVGRCSAYSWFIFTVSGGLKYAAANVDGKRIYLHRFITNAQPGQYVDHINGNSLDNRKENLRITTQSVNAANSRMYTNNTTGYRGVSKYRKGWIAQTKYFGRSICSNTLLSLQFAVEVRDALSLILFGPHTYLNLPDTVLSPEAIAEAERLIINQLT